MLHDEVSNVVRTIAAETEAGEALAVFVDELVLLHELAKLLEDLWKGGCDIDLLLHTNKPAWTVTREA